MVHGMGFKLGSLVKVLSMGMLGHIINVRFDKYNQPLYDIDLEDGEQYVARGMELDASLEATHASMRVQSKQ